jgi:hypothetical protein
MSAPLEKSMDLKNCTVKFKDGSSSANIIEIKMDEGNIKWTETRNIIVKRDRGEIDYLHEGDEEPCKVTLEGRFASITSSSGDDVTPLEFLTKTGAASAYKSTADACAADAIDIIVEVEQPCGTIVEDEIITFSEFTYQTLGGDFKAGQLSIDGICNSVRPTSVRTTLA